LPPCAALLGVLLLLLGACSSPPPDETPEPDDDLASERLALATWDAPACSPDSLTSSPTMCQGPWKYTRLFTTVGRDPYCGVDSESCATHASCPLWKNGIGSTATSVEPGSELVTCVTRCRMHSGEPLDCVDTCTPNLPGGWCADRASARATALRGPIETEINFEGGVPPSLRSTILNAVQVTTTSARTHISTQRSQTLTALTVVNKDRYTCNLNVSLPQKRTAQNDACTCTAWNNRSCEHPTGVQDIQYTAPGAVMPSGAFALNPSCSTCDGIGLGDPASVQSKYQCLSQALTGTFPTSVPAQGFRNAIVARLKLLFEYRANLMVDDATRAALDGLYASEPGAAQCHAPPTVDAGCLGEGAAVGLNGRVQACQNLDRDDVPVAVLRAELDYCFAGFDKIGQLAPGACREQYLRAMTTTTSHLLARVMAMIGSASGSLTNVPEALAAIDRWYEHAAAQDGGAGGGSAQLASSEEPVQVRASLRAATSAVVGAFWQRSNDALYTLPGTVDGTNVDSVLNQINQRNFDVEYQVLSAAFAAAGSLDSPPLLAIVGDALRSSVDQLETVSEMHDLACRYRRCAPLSTSQAAEMWRLIASLPDPTRLAAAVTAANALGVAHPTIRATFASIAARHAFLRAAFEEVSGGVPLTDVVSALELPPEAEELATLVRLADERWRNFQTDGLFLGGAGRALHAGMQNKQIVVQQLSQRVSALEAAYASFNDQRVNLVGQLVNELRNGQETNGLIDRVGIILQRMSDASTALLGLRARDMSERASFASYLDAFEKMRDLGVFDVDASANTDQLPAIDISGADAQYSLPGRTPAQLAVRSPAGSATPWKHTLSAGQSIRFNVSNDWTPSCAMQVKAAPGGPYNLISGPDGDAYHVTNIERITGPEGYLVQWTGSSFDVNTSNFATTYDQHASVEACLKWQQGTPGVVSQVSGFSFDAWVQLCAGLSIAQNISEASSDGTDKRTSASFAGGMHLDNTPYPEAPAGALLLVLTRAGTNTVVDTQVVGRQAAYIAPEDVDAYLVVNDFSPAASGGKCGAHGNRKLHVEAAQVTSFGAMADELAHAMAASLQEIRSATPAILAQGQLVPGEEQLLRLHARQRVAELTQHDVTQLPPAVQEFFDTWISAELVSLQRQAEMERHVRELRTAELERLSLVHERTAAGDQGRLARLAPRWLLRRLQTSRLGQDERALVRHLRDFVPPIFELRYPRALRDLLSSPDGGVSAAMQLDRLERLDFAASGDDIAVILLTFANKVDAALDAAAADASDYGIVRVAVTFPDPAKYHDSGTPPRPGCGMFDPCNEGGAPPQTTWHPVELTRAQQVWAGLRAYGQTTFTIKPEDLYDIHGGNGLLTCYDSAPIIRKIAVYVITTDGSSWGQLNNRPALQVGAEQVFPTATGSPIYVKTDSDWLFTGVPLLGGTQNEALDYLRTSDTSVGSGLSPFNEFTVDFANFPVPLAQTEQLVMTFELETRPIAAPGVAVSECRPVP